MDEQPAHLGLRAGGRPGVAPDVQRDRVAAQVSRLQALGATRSCA
ncbi:MAG TPA: hypothetical protein VF661_01855 [Actinomycetales bacterium]|jgi:hypothetical protein